MQPVLVIDLGHDNAALAVVFAVSALGLGRVQAIEQWILRALPFQAQRLPHAFVDLDPTGVGTGDNQSLVTLGLWHRGVCVDNRLVACPVLLDLVYLVHQRQRLLGLALGG
ncbi:hypothetical protein D3C75_1203820 [compost metagenome]